MLVRLAGIAVRGRRESRAWTAPSLVGKDGQFKQEMGPGRLVGRDCQTALELSHQPRNDLQSEARSGLVDVEVRRKADAAIGHFDVQAPAYVAGGDVNRSAAARVRMFHGVGNQFVDQEAERDGMIGGNQHRVGMAMQRVRPGRALQPDAELVHEVRKVNEADPRTAPEMVMDLGNGGDARSRFFEGAPDVIRLRAARLDPEQADDGCVRLFLTRWLISRVSRA